MLTQSYKTLIVTREETTSVPGVHFIICLDLFQSLCLWRGMSLSGGQAAGGVEENVNRRAGVIFQSPEVP